MMKLQVQSYFKCVVQYGVECTCSMERCTVSHMLAVYKLKAEDSLQTVNQQQMAQGGPAATNSSGLIKERKCQYL